MSRRRRALSVGLCALLGLAGLLTPPNLALAAPPPTPMPAATPAATSALSSVATSAVPGAPTPIPVPVAAAQSQKAVADAAVTALVAQITAAQARLSAAQGAADAAEQQFALQMEKRKAAIDAESAAQAQRQAAQKDVNTKHDEIVEMVIDAYMSGENMPGWSMAALITTPDLQTLLQQAGLKIQVSTQQTEVLSEYETSLASLTDAQDRARNALKAQNDATAQARQATLDAQASTTLAQSEQLVLDTALASAQSVQAQAAVALAVAQVSIAAVSPEQALALSTQYKSQAAAAANLPMAPNPGRWTAAMGQSAANRALQWLGTPYSWAGGGPAGPSRGTSVDADTANDANLIGFDCSGLAMYGWGPYQSMPHNAATQYLSVGSVHPEMSELMPGDLVFWSPGGGLAQISHVAMYIGNGNVVQAPHSGDFVKVTPLNAVESGYVGATRPLS